MDQLSGMSTDPAHLFMQLYDLLSDAPFGDRRAAEWQHDPSVTLAVRRVERAVLDSGYADHEQLSDAVREAGACAVMTLLRGLDMALQSANPFARWATYCGRLEWLRHRYEDTGLFNDPATMPGALLPRCAFPGQPNGRGHKADHFAVHRVPAGMDRKIEYRKLPRDKELIRERDKPITIACAPFLGNYADLTITFDKTVRPPTYSLGPARSDTARMRRIIERMDACEAMIGVLPEGCLSEKLLYDWCDIAERTHGPDASVQWLLVGSGPFGDPKVPFNHAALIHRESGEVILTHDKLERFTMGDGHAEGWRLPGAPLDSQIGENIRTGDRVTVLESSFGRLAVLICQDMRATQKWDRELDAFGVSHLLVPIFSKPISKAGWEDKAASRLVEDFGAWVVVSNSLVVPGVSADAEEYTCVILGPGDPRRAAYLLSEEYGRAEVADDIGWLRVGDHRRLPAVPPGGIAESWFRT